MCPDTEILRTDIIATARALREGGLVKGTSGNVSARVEGGFIITPTGIAYSELEPENLVRMDWKGAFDGELLPSSEWRFHRDILLAYPHLNAIVHTHSPYATAVAVLGRSIPAIHYRVAVVGGNNIPCIPYATFGTQELADLVVAGLRGRFGCLLAHHGAIAAHASVQGAFNVAEVIEEMARLFLLSSMAGAPPVLLDSDIAVVLERHKTYGQQPRAV